MTPDINAVITALRSDHPHHARARAWLDEAIVACDSGSSIEILPMVAAGFLRLVTNVKVFPEPSPIKEAIAFVDALLAIPGVEMPDSGREWATLRRICLEGKLSGNAIPDAWIAAAVISTNSHLVTFDRGFTRLLGRRELTVLSG